MEKNVPVMSYGIRTDFRTRAFPGSARLLEIAHTLEELKTICRCGRKALFNGRTVDGKFVFASEQVAIDGVHVGYKSLFAPHLLPGRTRRQSLSVIYGSLNIGDMNTTTAESMELLSRAVEHKA